jgi:hypothetical protein
VTVEELLGRLESVRRSGDGWEARCPAHDDRKPSLGVGEGDEGILVTCRAGCATENVVAALGLTMADLFFARNGDGPSSNGVDPYLWTPRTPRGDPTVAVYAYHDEDGKLVQRVSRTAAKQFPQSWPDGSKQYGWAWRKPGGARRVLYRLPELRAAIAGGITPIYVCEGEKDVEAIEKTGAVATCNPGGAGKWNEEYTQQLVGAGCVIVVADNDEPGIAHARAVAASLGSAGIQTTLALPAEGKDISDHLAAGYGLEELRPLEDEIRADDGGDRSAFRFLGLSHAEALDREIPSTSELVAGLVEAATVGTIAGLPETHKSFLALELAHKMTSGGAVLGRDILACGPVGYWWQDDSEANELRRIQAYAIRHGHTGELPIRWHLNEGLRLPEDVDHLRGEVEAEKQVLVVLDSLYNFLPGRGLKDEDVAAIVSLLKADICDATGCAICLVDHAPWPTEGNRGQRRAYGSVFKAAAIRWGIYLDREGEALWVEAHGNNVTGLKRSIATWDDERLELRLLEPPTRTRALTDELDDYLRRNPGATTSAIEAAVRGQRQAIRQALTDNPERFTRVPAVLFGLPKNAKCWARVEDAAGLLAKSPREAGDVGATLPPVTDSTSPEHPLTYVVGGVRGDVEVNPAPADRATSEGQPAGREDGMHRPDQRALEREARSG